MLTCFLFLLLQFPYDLPPLSSLSLSLILPLCFFFFLFLPPLFFLLSISLVMFFICSTAMSEIVTWYIF